MTIPSDVHLRRQAIKLFENGRSITEICQILGRSRTWFYKWSNYFRLEGSDGLHTRKRILIPHNRTPVKVEEAVIATIDQFPTYGPQRIAHILRRQ